MNHLTTVAPLVLLKFFLNSGRTCLPRSSKNEQIDIVIGLIILDSSMDIRAIYYHLQLTPLREEKIKEHRK